ncbi:hypothetical protein QUF80_15795 [Desulfococcaceae bacterium HSG8]|nr:hypothetical protein [Desulfococcaceae bacterium HSG8]
MENVKWRVAGGKWENIGKDICRAGQAVHIILPPGRKGVLCAEVAATDSNGKWVFQDVRVETGNSK